MMRKRSYPSPGAFRRALTDKLRDKAKSSRWTLPELQRHMAYDRLLERLYLVDEGWIVARDIGVRATVDVDVYRRAALEIAEAELRDALSREIGDWFRFEVGVARPVAPGTVGARIPVTALIGATVWAQFNVDIVGPELMMTGEPDDVPPLARVVMPDVSSTVIVPTPSSTISRTKSWRCSRLTARFMRPPRATRTWLTSLQS